MEFLLPLRLYCFLKIVMYSFVTLSVVKRRHISFLFKYQLQSQKTEHYITEQKIIIIKMFVSESPSLN